MKILNDYIRQYTSCLHVVYNYIKKNNLSLNYQSHIISGSCVRRIIYNLNNIELIQENYHLINCVIADACDLIKSEEKIRKSDLSKIKGYEGNIDELRSKYESSGERKKKTINRKIRKLEKKINHIRNKRYIAVFGGRNNFIKRCKGNITNKELKEQRFAGIYSTGNKQHFNRLFEFKDDSTIIFKPNRNTHIKLNLIGRNYSSEITSLLICQENKETACTFRMFKGRICISYEPRELTKSKYGSRQFIQNRIMSIDMNPNNIGWCITDWKSENEFNIVESGVISIKEINDEHFLLKGKSIPSDDPRMIYINNKRKHEVFEISKKLVNIAAHYKCEIFTIEKLKMNADDKNKGKKYNALCNNMWNRKAFIDNLRKRCDIFHIEFHEALPNYSSFVGNFLFRKLNLPDMCLAAFELGRRTYQYKYNYSITEEERKKNIMFPDVEMFRQFLDESLEEFCLVDEFQCLVKTYNSFKKANKMYRLSLDTFNLEFSRFSSRKSKIGYHFFSNIL